MLIPSPPEWPSVHMKKRPPPGLTIPLHQHKPNIFVGMMTKCRLQTRIPYLGHHILQHIAFDTPKCSSNLSNSSDRLHCPVFDIYFPTLGLGLHELLANLPRRQSAFPAFGRDSNFPCRVPPCPTLFYFFLDSGLVSSSWTRKTAALCERRSRRHWRSSITQGVAVFRGDDFLLATGC